LFFPFNFLVLYDRLEEGDQRLLVFADKLHDGRAVLDVEGVLLFFSELDVVFADAVTHK
jgi:hypothetical protein